jgi:hypothetical protein
MATDYYVSPSGKDTNSGSQSAPWQTINKVNSVNFNAGDQIFFQGSQTFNGRLYFASNAKGTATNPIVISSYGTGRATINGGTSDCLYAYDTAGLSISNLNFTGSGSTCSGTGIVYYNDLAGGVKLAHIYIDSVTVSGMKDGITIGAWNGVSGYDDVRITNASIHDNWDNNIMTYGQSDYAISNLYIGHCQAFNSVGDPTNTSRSSGNGIVLGSVNGGTVERCLAHDNGAQCYTNGGPVGIWCYASNAITIQYCEAWNNHGVNADGDGFDLDGDTMNSVMQYNYSHNNDAAGFLVCEYAGAVNPNSNNVVRYNISENDCRKRAYGGIDFYNGGPGLQNCEVYNNTVLLSPPGFSVPAVNVYSPTTNVHIRNNILVTTGGLPLVIVNAGQSGLVFDHNDYWSSGTAFSIVDTGVNYSSLSAWRSATGQEPSVGLSVDPLLTSPGNGGTVGNADNLVSLSAYKLQSSSPMINAALNLNASGVSMGSVDFYGVTTPQGTAYDIGANEALAANTPPVITSPAFATPNPTSVGSTVAFSVGASDGDNDALTYKWTFGDGGTATTASAAHSYSAAGSYTATVTVTDSAGNPVSSSVVVTVQTLTSPTVHVASISMSLSTNRKGKAAVASIAISDSNGTPVSGATVSGNWTGLTGGGSSGTTDTSGTATITSARTKNSGTFTLTVTNVAASGYSYNASQNVVSSGSIGTSAPAPLLAAEVAVTSQIVSLGSVPVGESFTQTLPLPASLANASKIHASANSLPAGVRVSGTMIGGKPKTAGTFSFTVTFQGKVANTDGKRSTTIKATQDYLLEVTP